MQGLLRRTVLTTALIALAALALAAPMATAVVPETEVAGSTSKWFSGSLLQQPGLNCSTAILGSAYTEIMVSGIAAYGGAPSGGVPAVGQRYWTSFLIAIPGNPCGPGSSLVQTELVLPPGTEVDTSTPIRCFGQPRDATTFLELTGQSWSAFGSSGPYCPSTPGAAVYNQGALSFGYRPLASGQLFQIFVPVKSTQQLVGAGASPADGFRWLTNATGVYANPGLSTVWANVFPSANSGTPFVYFQREAAIPFWKNDAPAGQENRVELFVNLFTAGQAGMLCYQVVRISDGSPRATCAIDPGYVPAVPAGLSLAQILPDAAHKGPNGGYVPFWLDPPPYPPGDPGEYGQDMRITWTFTPAAGPAVTRSADFRTLVGKDADGDGVPDASDACPAVKGTQPNGCLPTPEADPDKDGIYGAADLCPATDGLGAANGCPGGVVPPPATAATPPLPADPQTPVVVAAPALSGSAALKRGALLKRKALGKGLAVKLSCSRDAAASLSLSISAKDARKLKLKLKRGARSLVIAAATGSCKAAGGATLKLKLAGAVQRRILKAKGRLGATLSLRLSAPGAAPATSTTSVSVG